MPGLEKCESTLTGVTASPQGWSPRDEENPTIVLLNWVRVAFCLWTGSKLSLERNTLSFSFSLDLSMYSHKYERDHIHQELCPESAYVPVLLPSLTCSSLNRETKAAQETKDNTLNITQWLPCTPVSHFTFTESVSTQFLYSQHYPESCRINRAVPRAWLPMV